ncbi:C-X-C chemokine receptor type 2-like [Corythoichthys intestinalis]|uniref:C-X-C chemokine receptor type 2-like n=1 Tax=Corythoichthys intestinalis TaxID=161448 RepID=UPI0025A580DB|nr:C-X-C chemokine receptor type 2-like [Corythoichthys intestinalis]XP_061807534.1 C-X-C chemokine receptor type 2-like [Nerophis lumbriciformis]
MSIVISFDYGDYADVLNNSHGGTNGSPFVVDPDTLSCEARPALEQVSAAVLCVLLAAIFLLAVPGNLLVALVMARSWRSLTASDVYLFHLTAADGLMALSIPFWAAALKHGWIFGDGACKALSLIFEANVYAAILFLACISVDRYLAIVRTDRPRKSCSRLVCGAVWALGAALALPALFNDAVRPDPDSERMACVETFDLGSAAAWRLATRGLRHILGFALPLGIMLACYGATVVRLLRTRGFHKHRAMRVIAAVVVAFLFCWTPYHVAMVADTLLRAELIPFDCASRHSVSVALTFTNGLALLHCGVNPLLYAFVGEKFRKNAKALLGGKTRGEWSSVFSRSTSQTSEGRSAVA